MKAPRSTLLAGSVLLAAIGLGGCVDFDKLDHDNYVAGCKTLGIDQNSPDFNQCMMQQQRLNEADTQGILDREAVKGH
ncbi:MAG: hypothetical protein QM699_16285 [Amaricoccus sp.]|uniref:hypothetical protein n=1 Tax=Amaricoccus sp. TaxID=1872485 RepID=UPI0039E47053